MQKEKSILLIEPFTALPQTSGGRTRIFHTITELKKYFNLCVWSFVSNDEDAEQESSWLNEKNILYKHFKTQPKQFFSFLRHGQPYWFSDWWNQDLIRALKNLTEFYNVIQIESTQLLYLASFLPKTSKSVFVAYDVSSISFLRRIRSEKNILKKLLHYLRWLEIYWYERKYLPRFDEVIAVSEHDKAALVSLFGLKNVKVLPNGIEKINFLESRQNDGYLNLGYIGSFDHTPNFEAVEFILAKILPELEKQKINFKFYLAGANAVEKLNTLIENSTLQDKTGIINLNYVNNLADFYKLIDVLVAPIFAGSGTRVKILESLSFGRPVITTELGAEGIEIESSYLKIINRKIDKRSAAWFDEINQLYTASNNNTDLIKLNEVILEFTWSNIFKNYRS